MKLTPVLLLSASSASAFVPGLSGIRRNSAVVTFGYLDNLSKDLYSPDSNPDVEGDKRENTNAKEEEKDRFGVGSWDKYVEFDEFDGGDGQMGVAGDGQKGLEKLGNQFEMAKSKAMSAKNAWGTTTGYAQKLIEEQGMDVQKAQRLENWMNQQEVLKKRQAQRALTDDFDKIEKDVDWRSLASFGVERNEEFDLDEAFGPVLPGDTLDGTIELHARIGVVAVHEMAIKNEYMGFADFRAAFTPDTPMDWTVSPNEGALSKEPTNFIVKFKPENPGTVEGWLVIETEDFKKTYKVIGSTA